MTLAAASPRVLAAEALGTAMLVAGVVGSGIMATRLSNDVALQLLCNAIATGALLTVLILIFAPLSGASFNPVVTAVAVIRRELHGAAAFIVILVQIFGGIAGTVSAHLMFGMDALTLGTHMRSGTGQFLAEVIATFGLVLTIQGCGGKNYVAGAVGLYITAAYWFTASTSFANPAVTIARAFTTSFSGITPSDVPAFVLAQCIGGALAAALGGWLFKGRQTP